MLVIRRKNKQTPNKAHFSPVRGFFNSPKNINRTKTRKKKDIDILDQLLREAGY